MNVSGLTSSVSDARHLATIASAGADSYPPPARRASSSTTSKPTLWRVPLYFGPGFPSPAISFTGLRAPRSGAAGWLLLLLFLLGGRRRRLAFLVLLALLDDFGLRRCGRRCR